MTSLEIQSLLEKQRTYYRSGATIPVDFRIRQLKKLYDIKRVTTELSYGGGCINDVIIHLATSEMGFGGVGENGMRSYHGKNGFDAFSHYKFVVDKKTWLDLPMRYQPYKNRFYEKLLHIFLK